MPISKTQIGLVKIAVTSLTRHDVSTILLWNDVVWEKILTISFTKKEHGKRQCSLIAKSIQLKGDFGSEDAAWIHRMIDQFYNRPVRCYSAQHGKMFSCYDQFPFYGKDHVKLHFDNRGSKNPQVFPSHHYLLQEFIVVIEHQHAAETSRQFRRVAEYLSGTLGSLNCCELDICLSTLLTSDQFYDVIIRNPQIQKIYHNNVEGFRPFDRLNALLADHPQIVISKERNRPPVQLPTPYD